MDIRQTIGRHEAAVIDLRRRLHRIPEVGYEEVKTAAAIRTELDRLKIQHTDGVPNAPTATVALVGDPSKPCIALRADIDALPIEEQSGVPYASTHPGRMHACGHDGHTAMLVGVAAALKENEGRLPVCVKLIWQPAEEGGGGAGRVVEGGVLDGRLGPKVEAIFGLHGWPGMKVGLVTTRPGPLMAATDVLTVTFTGKGCHGAFPHLGRDPIVTACEAVVNLQQYVSRELDPTEPGLISIGQFNAGTADNIIPDTAWIRGTARTLNAATRKHLKEAVVRRCQGIAQANGCQAEVVWNEGYPPTINDPAMADYVAKVAQQALGADHYVPAARPVMGGEDFSYYLEKVPGCFFFVGLQPMDRDSYPSLHNDRFDFTDAAVPTGMRMFLELVMNYPVNGR